MSRTKPLPVAPSIAFERKAAKALLRALHASDPIALSRVSAHSSAIGMTSPQALMLSDAQLVIAREYGFTSWPRMVHYFEGLNRLHNRTPSSMNAGLWAPDALERSVFDLISAHGKRRQDAGRKVASYVPRYYGMRADKVFGAPLSVEEARVVVARSNGFPTFAELIDAGKTGRSRTDGGLTRTARERAWLAMQAGELKALQRLVEELPELLHPTDQECRTRSHVMADALTIEHETRRPELRAIIDWLGTVGFDEQRELNLNLCGRMFRSVDVLQYWLDRGADPQWIAPNGYSVLEHAIWRYSNGDAVDVIAARAHAKPALWIAAGLGDVRTVSTFLDGNGRPIHAVRAHRADFCAMGGPQSIQVPNATDEELLLEALHIAAINGRANVIEYLASRGAPIDSTLFGMPLISVAVGNRWVKVVEAMVRVVRIWMCGARTMGAHVRWRGKCYDRCLTTSTCAGLRRWLVSTPRR